MVKSSKLDLNLHFKQLGPGLGMDLTKAREQWFWIASREQVVARERAWKELILRTKHVGQKEREYLFILCVCHGMNTIIGLDGSIAFCFTREVSYEDISSYRRRLIQLSSELAAQAKRELDALFTSAFPEFCFNADEVKKIDLYLHYFQPWVGHRIDYLKENLVSGRW